MVVNDQSKYIRALAILQRAARDITPDSPVRAILFKTVELASDLMASSEDKSRYFSHLAVREGNRLYFDEDHNYPEVHQWLANSLGEGVEIDITPDENGQRGVIGITGEAAVAKAPVHVRNVRENANYLDLKNAGGSQIAVPIIIDDEVYAILNIEHEDQDAFDDADVQTMIALANIVAGVINSKENNIALEALINALEALTAKMDQSETQLQSVLDEVARQAYNLMNLKARKPGAFAHVGITKGTLLEYVSSTPEQALREFGNQNYGSIDLMQTGKYDETGERHRIGISGHAVVTNTVQNVPDVHEHPEYLMVNLERPINSQLAVPINLPTGDTVGVISIDHPSYSAFTREDEKNVQQLAEIAAQAIVVHRKNSQLRSARDTLVSMAEQDVTQLTPNLLLRFVTQAANRLFDEEIGNIKEEEFVSHLAMVKGDEVVFEDAHNDPKDYDKLARHGYQRYNYVNPAEGKTRGIVGRAALTNETQLVPNVNEDPDYFAIRRSGSQISVPIRFENNVYAILTVERDRTHGFDEQDKVAIEALAAQASAMLTILEGRLDAAKLEERARHSDNFIRFVRHDMKNPLTNVDTFLRSLRLDAFAHVFDIGNFEERYESAVRQLKKHVDQIERLMEWAKTDAGRTNIERKPIKLFPILNEVINEFKSVAAGKALTLLIDEGSRRAHSDMVIFADDMTVKSSIRNLVENAIKYTEEGYVKLAVTPHEHMAEIVVQDTGRGVSPDMRERIFEKYVRDERDDYDSRNGFGIGLALVKLYAEENQGRVTLLDSSSDGSTFALYLPIVTD